MAAEQLQKQYKSLLLALAPNGSLAEFQLITSTLAMLTANVSMGRNSSYQQASRVVSLLSQSLLKLATGTKNTTENEINHLSMSTSTFNLLITLFRGLNTSTLTGVSSVQVRNQSLALLPTILIPDSSTSVRVAVEGETKSSSNNAISDNLVVSVTQFDRALALQGVNNTATNTGMSESKLLSNIVSVRISAINQSSQALSVGSRPVFTANISLVDDGSEDEYNADPVVLNHHCLAGHVEQVHLLCEDSKVWLNLTCSGLAEAVVTKSCPVRRRVCNVVNVATLTVTDREYCITISTSARYVQCSCGLEAFASNTNSTTEGGKVRGSADPSVSVAVMSEYVASDLTGTVSMATTLSGSSLAEQSAVIFATLGGIWLAGIMCILLHFGYHYYSHKKGKTLPQETQPTEVIYDFQHSLQVYVCTILPTIFEPRPWLYRLLHELSHKHIYLRLSRFMCFPKRSDHDEHDTWQRAVALQITQLLTSITFSFFLVTLLYDFQYPNDDGSCPQYQTIQQCLHRRSLLDSSESYCKWQPSTTKNARAGEIIEVYQGSVLHSYPIDAAVAQAGSSCEYRETNPSLLTALIMAVLTSSVSSLLNAPLDFLFEVLLNDLHQSHHHKHDSVFRKSPSSSAVAEEVRDTNGKIAMLNGTSDMRQARNAVVAQWERLHLDLLEVPLNLPETDAVVNIKMQASPMGQGVALLHLYFEEQLAALSANLRPVALLHAVLEKTFYTLIQPGKIHSSFTLRFGSQFRQYIAASLIVAINVASLYYVMLKGQQRGYSWQRSFLVACGAQLVAEIGILEVFEVAWIDVLVPGMIANLMWTGVVQPFLTAAQNAAAWKCRSSTRYRSVVSSSYSLTMKTSPSLHAAALVPELFESSLLLLIHQSKHRESFLVIGDEDTMTYDQLRSKKWSTGYTILLWIITSVSIETQRAIVRFCLPFALAGLLLAWIYLQSLGGVILIVIVPVAVGVMFLWWWWISHGYHLRLRRRRQVKQIPALTLSAVVTTENAYGGSEWDGDDLRYPEHTQHQHLVRRERKVEREEESHKTDDDADYEEIDTAQRARSISRGIASCSFSSSQSSMALDSFSLLSSFSSLSDSESGSFRDASS